MVCPWKQAKLFFAARPSERLPTAYTGGAESSEVFYIGFLSERHPPPYKPQHAEIGSGTLIEQFQKSLVEDEKVDKEEVWSAIRYLDPDEREEDREVNTATIIATLAPSKITVMSFTTDGGEISRNQWRPDDPATSEQFSFFLDDKYCLVINLVFFSSFEQIVVFTHSEFKQSIADVSR
jgi:hypothetical protein